MDLDLLIAASQGDKGAIEKLLDDRTVNPKVNGDQTPLLWAAENGHESLVRLLLARGNINLGFTDPHGWTALSWAAANGHTAVVELLLDKGAYVDSKGGNNRTPLLRAAEEGHEAVVKLLLDRGARVNSEDNNGQTPLLKAAEEGHDAVVKLLLDKGAYINFYDNNGQTPLFKAAEEGHNAVVKLLLDKGVYVDSNDNNGQTPLSKAAEEGHEAVVQQLLDKGADVDSNDNNGQTPLFKAAERDHHAVVKLLLDKGADVNSKDNHSWTPLFMAAALGQEALMNQLLNRGANINSEDNDGRTPLFMATASGHEAVVKQMLDKGARVNYKDNNRQTPLFLAVKEGHEAVVKLLLAKDINTDSEDIDRRTPLSRAAEEGHAKIVELLLEKNSNPDSKDNDGRTPLSWAAEDGHPNIVELLLEKVSNPDSKDNNGRTPLSRAAENGHEAVVKLLLANSDVDRSFKDDFGMTPLSWARENGHEAVILLLRNEGFGPDFMVESGLTAEESLSFLNDAIKQPEQSSSADRVFPAHVSSDRTSDVIEEADRMSISSNEESLDDDVNFAAPSDARNMSPTSRDYARERLADPHKYFLELENLEAYTFQKSAARFYGPSKQYAPWEESQQTFTLQIFYSRPHEVVSQSSIDESHILRLCHDAWARGSEVTAKRLFHLLECRNLIFTIYDNLIYLRDEGLCEDRISLVVIDIARSNIARMLQIEVEMIKELAELFETTISTAIQDEYLTDLKVGSEATFALNRHCKSFLSSLGLVNADKVLSPGILWRCVVHTLDLALLSYTGAHIEPFDKRYIGPNVGAFQIPGPFLNTASVNPEETSTIITMRRRVLKCLDDFLDGNQVWVFHPESLATVSGSASDERLYLATDIVAFADIWGPLWKVCPADDPAQVSRYKVGKGFIIPSEEDNGPLLRRGEVLCHWSSQFQPVERSFSDSETLVIGTGLTINENCTCSPIRIKQILMDNNRLRKLGTTDPSRYTDAETVELQVGPAKGVTGKYSRTYKRRCGHSLKQALLENWEHPEIGGLHPEDLEKRYGLEVSLFTENARKVPLVCLLGSSSMENYLRPFQWSDQDCKRQYMEAVRNNDPGAISSLWYERETWREDIRKAVLCCLRVLSETGVGTKDEPNTLYVAWVSSRNSKNLVMFKQSEHSWIRLLKDSRDYFTMAVASEKCLDFAKGNRCSGIHGRSVLETALIVNKSIKPQWLRRKRTGAGNGEYYWHVSRLGPGEDFPIGEHHGWKVIEQLDTREVLMQWDASIFQPLKQFKAVLFERREHHECVEDDEKMDIEAEDRRATLNSRRNRRTRPLQVFLMSQV